MSVTSQSILDKVDAVRFNPSKILTVALDYVEGVLDGTATIGDSTNPMVLCLETSAINAAACCVDNANTARKLYSSMASTPEDLYLHMSDADYIGRFATPSKTTITMLLGLEEAKARAVATGVGATRKLTIPRHTAFTVNGATFTMQYPIDIRVMGHGGLQIVYDAESPSPLETLSTNLVNWTTATVQGIELIVLHIPVSQFVITSFEGTANASSAFVLQRSFSDQFYYARAYYLDPTTSLWREMISTHTDQVFDPTQPTALLKLLGNTIQMSVPQVYSTAGLVGGEFRLDVYTTKGPLSMSLSDYAANAYAGKFEDLEATAESKRFWEPMTAFTHLSVLSDARVSGGSLAMSFEELRDRNMSNSNGPQDVPITNANITHRLTRLGYDAVTDVDNITNRQILATRQLPPPADNTVSSGAACTIQTVTLSMLELAQLSTVRDNGNRVTIMPQTLYQITDGLVSIVPQPVVDAIQALPIDVRARRINDGTYLYTPFHYVLDQNNNRFEQRPYYLDDPKILTKSFVEENDTTGMQVTARSYSLVKTPEGYELTVILASSDNWKALADSDVYCQLSFVPVGQKDRAYLNGELLGTVADERTYLFTLETNYDLDDSDNIFLTSFSMYDEGAREHATGLVTDFDIMFIANDLAVDGLTASNIDVEMGRVLLPENAMGISRERFSIRLGSAMHGLWASSRSVASSLDYERHAADVPAVWETTVFERDANGTLIFVDDGNGGLTYKILHAKGDPMLGDNGQPLMKFLKGDVVLDPEGDPVVVSSRRLARQLDMLLLDGVYWFATDDDSLAYKASIPQTIVGWLDNDIGYLTQFLLDQTNLYFYPKATLGQVDAIVREGQSVSISAAQSFTVAYYLTAASYRDSSLRESLTALAERTIADVLSLGTVTMNTIISRLTASAGDDIVSVAVEGLGGFGTNAQQAITLQDDSARLSIRKIAAALADGTIGVRDDVTVSFLAHNES